MRRVLELEYRYTTNIRTTIDVSDAVRNGLADFEFPYSIYYYNIVSKISVIPNTELCPNR